jgi:hypothetical protein
MPCQAYLNFPYAGRIFVRRRIDKMADKNMPKRARSADAENIRLFIWQIVEYIIIYVYQT